MPSDLPRRSHPLDESLAGQPSDADRRARALMVGITLFAVVTLVTMAVVRRPPDQRTVWLTQPLVVGEHLDPQLARRLDTAARDALERRLAARRGLAATSIDLSPAAALERARGRDGRPIVDEVVRVTIRCLDARRCLLDLTRHRAVDGSVLWQRHGPRFDADDPMAVDAALGGEIALAFVHHQPADGGPRLHVDPASYAEWLDLRAADAPDLDALAALSRRAPRFVGPYLLAARQRADAGEPEAARRLLDTATRIAPDDHRPVALRRALGLDVGRDRQLDPVVEATP